MAGNQKLSGFRLWWRKMRKWVFGVLAAAIMGMLLFYPGMAYIYERIGWRSPLLPRPGERFFAIDPHDSQYDDYLKVRWATEDLTDYAFTAARPQIYPPFYGLERRNYLLFGESEAGFKRQMNKSVALVVLEIVDYVDMTSKNTSASIMYKFCLAHCRVNQILAKRHDVCNLQEGESIVVWMPHNGIFSRNARNGNRTPIRCGDTALYLLEMTNAPSLYSFAKQLSFLAPYRAPYNTNDNHIPIEQGKDPNLASVSNFIYLPDAEARYGPYQYWTLDMLSRELQDYYDKSTYPNYN